MLDEEKNFYLQGGNLEFNDRQKNVFEKLDRLGSLQPSHRFTQEELKFQSRKLSVDTNKKDLKAFMGRESIFKRPEADYKKSTKLKIPDFLKNPHKWKKYKLSADEMSDKSNRDVAMAFLEEMKTRNKKMDVARVEGSGEPIRFSRRIRDEGRKLAEVDREDKPSFVNGKYVMPEYVVGQKVKKGSKEKQETKKIPKPCVKLEHLLESDSE